MNRRWSGGLVLILSAMTILAAPRILNPGIPGHPGAALLPEPPQIGSCMVSTARARSEVPCSAPHDLEITARWLADDPDLQPAARDCGLWAFNYLGHQQAETMGIWATALVGWNTRVIHAPREDSVGTRGWSACSVMPPSLERYTGSVRGLATAADRPAAYGHCADGLGKPASCTKGHVSESFGTAAGFVADGVTSAVDTLPATVISYLSAQCRQLVKTMSGAADPTYGQQLAITIDSVVFRGYDPAAAGSADASQGVLYSSTSQIHTLDDHLLTGSVFGLGDQALPFA
jgi:hypothetical protein